MDRREFLKVVGAGSAAIALAPLITMPTVAQDTYTVIFTGPKSLSSVNIAGTKYYIPLYEYPAKGSDNGNQN